MQQSLLVLALVLAVVWLVFRLRKPSADSQPAAPEASAGQDTTYHAVSIDFESQACAAAKAMDGRRFLSTAAPRLPLPECDAPECRCRFVHHKDRRSGRDRRSPFTAAGFGGGTGAFERERRERSDRRRDPN